MVLFYPQDVNASQGGKYPRFQNLGERQNKLYLPLASLEPPGRRFKSLTLWESRPERPESVCITLVVFNLPLALVQIDRLKGNLVVIWIRLLPRART